jgi:antitoxin (DNA-binding transcriptional repressor) of toxin-antitoxin stability system
LGWKFRSEVLEICRLIVQHPLPWRELAGGYRRVNCPVFPYSIVYFILGIFVIPKGTQRLFKRPGATGLQFDLPQFGEFLTPPFRDIFFVGQPKMAGSFQRFIALFLKAIKTGSQIILSDNEKPVARLIPVGGRVPGLHSGSIWTSNDFDEPLSEASLAMMRS